MLDPRLRRCETCRFWDWEDSGSRGRCRVNPPETDDTWPWTNYDDWCGKYLINASLPPLEHDD